MTRLDSKPRPECCAAETADAPEIADLLRSSIIELCVADHGNREQPLRAWLANKTPTNVKAWIRNPANIMLVATIDGQVAGAGCLRTDGHIILNYVAPIYRFRGVSRAILMVLERHARDLRLPSLELESTETAHRFYQVAGFSDIGPAEIKHGIPAYPMAKRLI